MTEPRLHRIALGPNSVSESLALVGDFAGRHAIGSTAALAIVVEELVCNLVDHRDTNPQDAIGLCLEREAGGVRLTLIDEGAPFDPRRAPPPGDLPPDRGGGAGLALVLAWSRELNYTRVGRRNRLELVVPDE